MIWGLGGRLYDHLMSMRILTWIMNKIIIRVQLIVKQMATGYSIMPIGCPPLLRRELSL